MNAAEEQIIRILIGCGAMLIVHAGIVYNLSSVMGRYRGPGGRVVNPIATEPQHLFGLALAIVAGLVISIDAGKDLFTFQIILWVILVICDSILVWRAIKWVDRFSSDIDSR